jgi:hypothetical protein
MAKAKKRKKTGSKRKSPKRKAAPRKKKRKASTGARKTKRKGRKAARSKHIPLGILQKRHAKLGRIISSRTK